MTILILYDQTYSAEADLLQLTPALCDAAWLKTRHSALEIRMRRERAGPKIYILELAMGWRICQGSFSKTRLCKFIYKNGYVVLHIPSNSGESSGKGSGDQVNLQIM